MVLVLGKMEQAWSAECSYKMWTRYVELLFEDSETQTGASRLQKKTTI